MPHSSYRRSAAEQTSGWDKFRDYGRFKVVDILTVLQAVLLADIIPVAHAAVHAIPQQAGQSRRLAAVPTPAPPLKS